jgi:hypothetical protein
MITVRVESTSVMRSLNRLQALTGKPMETLVKQSARRVCVNLSRTIAPFGFDESAKAQGEGAVKVDYGRSTMVRSRYYLKHIQKLAKTTDDIAVEQTSKGGVPYTFKAAKIELTGNRLRSSHNSKRNRKGRVPKLRDEQRIATIDSAKDMAMKKALKRVGLAKYAYAMAAKSLGGTRGIPAWVKRSRGIQGVGSSTISRSKAGYTVVIENNLKYASHILSTTGEKDSLKREADYLKREVDAKITGAWKK